MSDIQNLSGKSRASDEVADEQDRQTASPTAFSSSQPLDPLDDQRRQREERDGEDHEHEVGHADSPVIRWPTATTWRVWTPPSRVGGGP